MNLLIKLEIVEGESGYSDISVIQTKARVDKQKFANYYAKEFFGVEEFFGVDSVTEGSWHFSNDLTKRVRPYDVIEVSDEDYLTLKKYL